MRLKRTNIRTNEVLINSPNMSLSKCISLIESCDNIILDNIWTSKDINGKLKLKIKCNNILYEICG